LSSHWGQAHDTILQLKNAWAGVVNAPTPKATVPANRTTSASLANVVLSIILLLLMPAAADVVRCVNTACGPAAIRLSARPAAKTISEWLLASHRPDAAEPG